MLVFRSFICNDCNLFKRFPTFVQSFYISVLLFSNSASCCFITRIYYKGGHQVIPPIIYFKLSASQINEIFREIYNGIPEGRIIFQCSLHLCQQSSPASEQEHAFSHHKSSSPFPTPLQSFMQGSLQCFVIGIMVSCFFWVEVVGTVVVTVLGMRKVLFL